MWFIDIGFQLLKSTFALACKTTHTPNKYPWSLGGVLTHAKQFFELNFHVVNEITYYAPKNVHLAPLGWRGGGQSFFLVEFLCFHQVPNDLLIMLFKFSICSSICSQHVSIGSNPPITFPESFECVLLDVPNKYMHYPIKFTQNWTCIMYKGETKESPFSNNKIEQIISQYVITHYLLLNVMSRWLRNSYIQVNCVINKLNTFQIQPYG